MSVCTCRCHIAPDDPRAPWARVAVDVRRVVEAAVACDRCRNQHTPALRATALANESDGRDGHIITPEGVVLSWAEYSGRVPGEDDAC